MGRSALALALGIALIAAAPAAAADPPAGAISDNVEFLGNLPEAKDSTAINFMTYGKGRHAREVMFVTGRFGLKSYDLSDPADPQLLDDLGQDPDDPTDTGPDELKLEGDTSGTYWQNEDMDLDRRRKLVFLSRDPRSYDGSTSDPSDIAGVYIVDASDPADLRLITFQRLPTGHTTTCVNDCDFLWTGGPASNSEQADAWPGGRPIVVTDIRDPENPQVSPMPVDLFRRDGTTAYSHDVQVDARGIAWVSGSGGTRGYWTEGFHYDPLEGERRWATATDPIPYAGGGMPDSAVGPTPGGFMHNAERPVGSELRDGPRPGHGHPAGSLLLATEEDFNGELCRTRGQFVIASLEGSYDGQGWRSTPEDPFRLKEVGTWNPAEKEGTVEGLPFCSAHYFDVDDGIVTYAWYGQGTRFLDIRDPTNPRQIAYYRPDGGNVWASYNHNGYIYTADHARGIDILRLEGARRGRREVTAPRMSRRQVRFIRKTALERFAPDPQLGYLCPIPKV